MLAVAHDAIARRVANETASNFHHASNIAVSQWQRLIEFVENSFKRWHETIGLDLVEHHAHFVRLLARLLDPSRFAKLYEHALCSNRHQRAR